MRATEALRPSSPTVRARSWASSRICRGGRRSSIRSREADVEAILISPARLRDVMVAEAETGEKIMRALILRRVALLEQSVGGPVIVGRRGQPRRAQAREFPEPQRPSASAPRSRHRQLRQDADRALPCRRAASFPSCFARTASCLRNPSENQLARCIGMTHAIDGEKLYDVAIVGAGPAGLAAAVYATSEGLVGHRARLPRLRRPGRALPRASRTIWAFRPASPAWR